LVVVVVEEELEGPAKDDDVEVELAAVDDVSFAVRFAVGFEALECGSIPGARTVEPV